MVPTSFQYPSNLNATSLSPAPSSSPWSRRPPPPPRPDGFADPIRQTVESLLGRITGELETEDLILLLILYLLYRESGDTEMLFILGAMLLL